MSGPLSTRSFDAPFSDDIPAHWLPGNPAISAALNIYTVLVPSNEAFYMRTVAHCLPGIEDQALKAAGRDFIHQEAQHGVAHKRFWRVLDSQGYRFRWMDAFADRAIFRITERIAPLAMRMSIVSCVEHINAYLAHEFLRQRILADARPEVRAMIEWHFAEEIEHKAVAYDVLTALWPSYILRLLGWMLTVALFYGLTTAGMCVLLLQDGGFWKLGTWRNFVAHLGARHGMLRRTLRHLFDYLRPSFHPSQLDDAALAEDVIARYGHEGAGWLSATRRGTPSAAPTDAQAA